MEVDAALYPRKEIERARHRAVHQHVTRHGENDRRMANDWRPEIHDSDGLSMWTGSGEWIWRPLRNPRERALQRLRRQQARAASACCSATATSSTTRTTACSTSAGPSLWVEPKARLGRGRGRSWSRFPTDDETYDNIVAFWNPSRQAASPAQELLFGYRLYWGAKRRSQPPLARCVATRTGIGGVVGQHAQILLVALRASTSPAATSRCSTARTPVEPVISVSRGRSRDHLGAPAGARCTAGRAMFDVVPDAGLAPITVRLYLARQRPAADSRPGSTNGRRRRWPSAALIT